MVYETRAFSLRDSWEGILNFFNDGSFNYRVCSYGITRKRRLNIVYDKCARQCNLN